MSKLLEGKELDSIEIAKTMEVEAAGGRRMAHAVLKYLPHVEEVRDGRRRVIRYSGSRDVKKPNKTTAVAACLGTSLAPLFNGSNYERGLREALDHVLRAGRRASWTTDIERKFIFARRGGEVSLPEHANDLDEIIDALLEHNLVRITYSDFAGETKERTIEPLSLLIYEHQLYVIARRPEAPLRTYRFSRISEAARLDDTFTYPTRTEYDPDQIFRDSFGVHLGAEGPVARVIVRLSPKWGPYAKSHRWHQSQVIEEKTDHTEVRLSVRVCPELVAWIRSFGPHAEVVAPEELSRLVKETLPEWCSTASTTLPGGPRGSRRTG